MRFVVDASQRARVLVSGPDAPAFLHRLSTQHVSDLKVGDARLNAFTTDKGRLKDLVHHVVLERGVVLIGHQTTPADLVAWLDRYLFSEKVELHAAVSEVGCQIVDAATADDLVPGAGSLAPWQFKQDPGAVVVRTFDRVDRAGTASAAFLVLGANLPVTLGADDDLAMSIASGTRSGSPRINVMPALCMATNL